jgi:hypothetical protein
VKIGALKCLLSTPLGGGGAKATSCAKSGVAGLRPLPPHSICLNRCLTFFDMLTVLQARSGLNESICTETRATIRGKTKGLDLGRLFTVQSMFCSLGVGHGLSACPAFAIS